MSKLLNRMLSPLQNLGQNLGLLGLAAILVLMMTLAPAAHAMLGFGFSPQVYKSGYTYGSGIYFAPYEFDVHAEPSDDSPVLRHFRWSRKTQSNAVIAQGTGTSSMPADHVFFCFYPELDVAMMAVVSEPGNGWVEVVYDQANRRTGWVKLKDAPPTEMTEEFDASTAPSVRPDSLNASTEQPEHFGVYQTWLDFMRLNARANGVYWLSGVSQYHRSIRTSDKDEAKFINVTIVRDIKVRHIRGNWLLVEVLDFERNTPIGWVRWRDNDGNLMVFPNISGERRPIVTTTL